MPIKRRRSSSNELEDRISKKIRTRDPLDFISSLSDELLIRILHRLPTQALIQCQRVSHRFYALAGDSQIWKNLYYTRFVLPRALRIPGIKKASGGTDEALHFSSRRSKWLDDNEKLVNRVDGKKTNWKRQYKLRHNWSIGACEMQEIHVAETPSVPEMLVKLADGVVLTADKEDGLRAWDLKQRSLIAEIKFESGITPTCLAVDEQDESAGLGIAVGFWDGGWGIWRLDIERKLFVEEHRHSDSDNGKLIAVAYAKPYILTITHLQLLSLYSFTAKYPKYETKHTSSNASKTVIEVSSQRLKENEDNSNLDILNLTGAKLSPPISLSQNEISAPRLLASLKSHTSWPPLSLSIRTTSTFLIASIAYSLPTYFSGYTVGLQELHLSLSTGSIIFSRLASASPQGFYSILSSPPGSGTSTPSHSSPSNYNPGSGEIIRPTTLSYAHPYILATHPDNTLTLYMCTSTASSLSITPGTKLWGHTSSVSSAEITPRGKAVSVSTRGNELRVWELEGGLSSRSSPLSSGAPWRKRGGRKEVVDRSVRIAAANEGHGWEGELDENINDKYKEEMGGRKRWVGFDDEMVIVLRESGTGSQALMVYDFT